MNIGYVIMILSAVIAIASGIIYGFNEIALAIVIFIVLFGVILLTRKKR